MSPSHPSHVSQQSSVFVSQSESVLSTPHIDAFSPGREEAAARAEEAGQSVHMHPFWLYRGGEYAAATRHGISTDVAVVTAHVPRCVS